MEQIFAVILTILLTVLSIRISIIYSSKYVIKKKNKGREKYIVSEKIETRIKEGCLDSARIILEKSSFDKAMGFMDISLMTNNEEIIIDRYAFINTCTHNLLAPGKIILRQMSNWEEQAPSNRFDKYFIKSEKLEEIPYNLIPKKIKRNYSDFLAVESNFEYPSTYTGPRYNRRLVILAKNVGIVYFETEYKVGHKDYYILKKFKIKNESSSWFPFNSI